ncbi:MAG: sigma-70 family RNA polymerase sigma factor [Phycisphaeraceae bacterium]
MTTQLIWQQFRDELDAFIRRRVANAADAEDLRQQVYLHIHRHLKHNDPPQHLRGWVYQIARNAITDHHRRRAGRREQPTGETDLAAKARATEAEASAAEAAQGLARCLLGMVDRLPEPYGQALRWTELEGMTQQQAAARAGVSLSGMKSRVQRGRAKLQEALLACCEVEFDARRRPTSHRCRSACNCSS